MTITLICGLPNAGKTTYSSTFNNVIHLDDHHMSFRECNNLALESTEDVCIEGVYNRKKCRIDLLNIVPKEWHKKCIWLNTPVEECIKRENRGRGECFVTCRAKRFEPPTEDEGWDEIKII